jgi:tRNA(adenine34) deaminase
MPARPSVSSLLPDTGDDDRYMDAALEEAQAAPAHGDVPIGAVVVRGGNVIGRGHDRREVERDPTAHAEILALRQAAALVGSWRLEDCALYVTVEPCVMCAGATILARIPLVVFAAPEDKTGAVVSTVDLFDDPRSLHRPKWRMGTRRSESTALLQSFFAGHRRGLEVR